MTIATKGTIFAHSHKERPTSEWQELRSHLEGVAELAERFCAAFGAAPWGHLAGLWHDLGKFRQAFQEYIRRDRDRAEHSVVGALLARARAKSEADPAWVALAFVIAGHHGGLPNIRADGPRKPLIDRLDDRRKLLAETLPGVPEDLREHPLPPLPARLATVPRKPTAQKEYFRTFEFWIRFLFSALVDADFLDTERFYRGDERTLHTAGFDDIAALRARLDAFVDAKSAAAEPTQVNALRAEVLAACRSAAAESPGLFSLTVPTGGGKTLSAMAFALRHAEGHELRRVIAVIPFTSIIEQNAAVYRHALGAHNVIEHHSNLDPEKESRRNKLASENWDAPVIVTTAVQFFESLFGNRTSRCRKLHNIARSVVLLDEVQTLPTEFQTTILAALRELTANYGCSVVLSTATQPAFKYREEEFDRGLRNVREIVRDPRELARRLERFHVEWPAAEGEPVTWADLAAELASHPRVLAIVHRRGDARELAEVLPEEGRFHLSALMCAAHRSRVLRQAEEALRRKAPCRLVSTQLVEAGVDIDFPVVYRTLGGLDSLTQAGGRCNREGSPDKGRMVVFRAPTKPPRGTPSKGLATMEMLLRLYGKKPIDLSDPELVTEYFRMLFGTITPDVQGIEAERQQRNFANVARKFRLIDDYSKPVVVPYGDATERLDRLRAGGPSREALRALQPYVVNVARWHLERLDAAQAVELVHDAVFALNVAYAKLYDKHFGLILEGELFANPESLIVSGTVGE
ncbi:MAG: CRISPR-associated endonuclease Cas3'' [bacterium]|nr:CRISPR-associated endonuclease Cas3'' [bacterium]